jgi:CRP/FNR family cyclic AMP-dependent transcriptional regulator
MSSQARQYRKGASIWQPDDPADSIYFLKRGQVAVMTSDQEGREMILRVIDEGEPFGELCFCAEQGSKRQTTARAVTDTDVVEIKFNDFLEYLHNDNEALTALLFTLCVRLTDAYQRAEILALRNAEERLGRLLLQLASSRGIPDAIDQNEVTLLVGHEELVKLGAMSRPHVTVTMVKLRRHGLVRNERRGLITVNVPALKEHLKI